MTGRHPFIPTLALLALLTTGYQASDAFTRQPGGQEEPTTERLAYTVTYLGIAVARTILDQSPPSAPDGEWVVRAAAHSTRFWDAFFHIRNTYTSRFNASDFLPSVYERRVDQGRLRFRRVDHYVDAATDSVAWTGLPSLPDRYAPVGTPERIEVARVAAGQENLFSALWFARFADWDTLPEATRHLFVDGVRWRVHIRREEAEERRTYEGRMPTWRLTIGFQRLDPPGSEEEEAERRRQTDYLTKELVRESATITLWIAREPARRPVEVVVKRPGMTVKAELREPFETERRQRVPAGSFTGGLRRGVAAKGGTAGSD